MLDNLVSKDNARIDAASDRLAIFADPEGNLPGAKIEARNIRTVYLNSDSGINNRCHCIELRQGMVGRQYRSHSRPPQPSILTRQALT